VGTKGLYEEHGFGSVLQFIADNEKGSSKAKLFRPNSQRIIVFLSDENDQSIEMHRIAELGSNPKLLYRDSYYTGKDVAKADAKLPAHFTIDCPESVVEGETLAPMSICVRSGFLMPVERFKSELDGFF